MSTTSPENSNLSDQARRNLWMHFSRMGTYETHEVPVIVRGEGAYVWDQHGKRYLDGLAGLFTADATYLQSPYEQPVTGLGAIKRMWEEQREGPREVFTLVTEILAVDGPTAVVRAEVHYGDPPRQEYRDLWVIRLGDDGRCTWFEEWPYWPGRPHLAPDGPA